MFFFQRLVGLVEKNFDFFFLLGLIGARNCPKSKFSKGTKIKDFDCSVTSANLKLRNANAYRAA